MHIRSASTSYGRGRIPIIVELPAMFHDPSNHRYPQQNYSPADRQAYELWIRPHTSSCIVSLSLSLTFVDEIFQCFSLFLIYTYPKERVENIGKPVIFGVRMGEESGGPAHSAPGGIEIPKAANAGADRGCCVWGAKERHHTSNYAYTLKNMNYNIWYMCIYNIKWSYIIMYIFGRGTYAVILHNVVLSKCI